MSRYVTLFAFDEMDQVSKESCWREPESRIFVPEILQSEVTSALSRVPPTQCSKVLVEFVGQLRSSNR